MIGLCPCMTEPPRVRLLSRAGQILHAWLSQYHTWRCKSGWQHPERRGGEAAGGRGHGVIYHWLRKLPLNPPHFSTLRPPPPHLESLDPVWTSPEAGSLRAAATSCVQWDRIYGTCQLRFPPAHPLGLSLLPRSFPRLVSSSFSSLNGIIFCKVIPLMSFLVRVLEEVDGQNAPF